MANQDGYIYYVIDPTSHPGQENTINTDDLEELFDILSNQKTGNRMIDASRAITRLYKELERTNPSIGASIPPPVPEKKISIPKPVEALPPLPMVEDSPKQQGAPGLSTDEMIIVEVQPSKGAISPQRFPDYYWGLRTYDLPGSAEELASRITPSANPDFEAFIRRTLRNEPAPGEVHPSYAAPASRKLTTDADPIDLFTGAFTIGVVDLVIPTAHIPIAFSRSYRSGRPYYGPFGYGWDHTYNVYLRELNDGGIALWTGQLQEQKFHLVGADFEPESGFAGSIERAIGFTDAYEVRFPSGLVWQFDRPTGWSNTERIPLTTIRDRYGNSVNLSYDTMDRLFSVLDTANRGLLFSYGGCDLLERVTDHTGTRIVSYWHDNEIEHLVRVVLPTTAQYPNGLSITYEYDIYNSHPAMQHNILRIHDADNRLMVENEFAGPEAGWEFNSVVRQRLAGFEYQFEYQQIQYVWPDPVNVDALSSRTLVHRPDGSFHTYTFNYRGDLLDHRFRLIRDGSYRVVANQWEYDAEGNVTKTVGSDGLRKFFQYDSSNTDPCARHNLLSIRLGYPFSGILPDRIVYKAVYEPRYQLITQTTDEVGAETQYFYDFDVNPSGNGKLVRIQLQAVVDANGLQQQSNLLFEYNSKGQLIAFEKPEGGRTELTYFSGGIKDGFLLKITQDPTKAQLITTFDYDTAGFPKLIQAPGGRITGCMFNAIGQMEILNSPEINGQKGSIHRWFDDSGAVIRMERPAGSSKGALHSGTSIVDEYERDQGGNIHSVTLAANTNFPKKWLQNVDHDGRPLKTWNAAGTRIDRCFGEDGLLLSETAAAGDAEAQTTKYTYDYAGRLTGIVGPWKETMTFRYDLWGRLESIKLPSGAVRTFVSDKNDRLVEIRVEEVDPVGVTPPRLLQRQTYEYDKRSRLISSTLWSFREIAATAIPLKTSYFYDKDDQLRKVLLPRGAQVLFSFDPLGRPTKVIDPHGNVRQFIYNPFGDLSQLNLIEDDNGVARTTTRKNIYDGRGRLTSSEYLGTITQYKYDDRGLIIEQRSPTGVTNQIHYDAFGQGTKNVIDPGGLALSSLFEYDLNGQLNRYIDPTGQASVWSHDKLGRTVSFQPPDGTTWEYITNRLAQTLEQRMPSGNKVIIEYDKDKILPSKLVSVAALGQEAVAPQAFHYDGLGRLISASATAEVIERKYDSLNRLIEETARGKTVRMEFDDITGSTDLVYPDGRVERTAYNFSGKPTSVTLITPGELGGIAGELLLHIKYSSAGRPVQMSYSNGVEGQLVYDDQGRVIRLEYQKGGILIESSRLRYNENGQRSVVQYLGAPVSNLVHRFDGNNRLVEARKQFPLTPLPDITSSVAQVVDVAATQVAAIGAPGVLYNLNDADVRIQVTGLNGGATNETYVSTNDHRTIAVGSNPIFYNTDGVRIMDAHYRYELDALSRVRRVRDRTTNAIVAELSYDALSRIKAGVTDSQEFERWFSGSTRIHDIIGPGTETLRQHSSHPLWPTPFYVVDAGGPAFIHQDEGWSTICVTDNAGAVLERHRYDHFGASALFAADGVTPLTSFKTEPNWRSMQALGTTTLFTTTQRLYDPEIGVFTSRDPLLYVDSPSPYTYAAHNPIDFADPTGLAKTPISAPLNGHWVKETIIHEEEVHFYEGQNTPPSPPDHKHGFYPLKDADKYLSQQYGTTWETIKLILKREPLSDALGIIEDLNPVNAPDHFLSAGSYAKRWVWFSQRGQSIRGLFELFQGYMEATSAVGGVQLGGALLKGGASLGTAAIAQATKAAEGPKAYSVALEIKLASGEAPSYLSDAGRRTRHRDIGQDFTFKLVDSWNKSLNPEERELGKRMSELLKNSNEWELHHVADPERAGVLQLVLREQHQAPSYQNLFHPLITKSSGRVGRVGGFYYWGRNY